MLFTAREVVTKTHGTAALIRPGALSLHTARHAPESTNRQLSRLGQPRVTKGVITRPPRQAASPERGAGTGASQSNACPPRRPSSHNRACAGGITCPREL
eukprot:scaffold23600_cov69-Phaeocystis_antarctica.AAC.4